jgi:D-lactate dehydrogenase (cytochrome)
MIAQPAIAPPGDKIADLFRDALPSSAIIDDPQECALASGDIAGPGVATATAILRPQNRDQAVALVDIARREACALFPRGGGWSYSSGYTPSQNPAVIVDMGQFQAIALERDAARVTVGAGVTWGALYETLDAAGLRVPSFGPLSGIGATVGGLVAQNGGFFGAAGHGPIADGSVISSTMIAGNGEALTLTAADRVDGAAAPQPFAGDCGAFGLRTEITLATMPRPATTLFASFAFGAGEDALAALCSLAGIPGLGEAYLFDPATHANLAGSGFSVLEGAAFAGDLLAAGKGPLGGIADIVRAARWKRTALAEIAWSLHLSVDGNAAAAPEAMAEAAGRAVGCGGEPIPDVIPRVTRARPFRPIKALLGPDGELWLPANGVFGLDAAEAGFAAVAPVLAGAAATARRHGIRTTILAVLMGDRVVIEPQLFWPDALSPLHRRLCRPDQVAAFGDRPGRPTARAAAHELRRALIDAMDAPTRRTREYRTAPARAGVPGKCVSTPTGS